MKRMFTFMAAMMMVCSLAMSANAAPYAEAGMWGGSFGGWFEEYVTGTTNATVGFCLHIPTWCGAPSGAWAFASADIPSGMLAAVSESELSVGTFARASFSDYFTLLGLPSGTSVSLPVSLTVTGSLLSYNDGSARVEADLASPNFPCVGYECSASPPPPSYFAEPQSSDSVIFDLDKTHKRPINTG